MREETIQDDILFDRLVDGELSAAERRVLLESLDEQPEGWRRCALAFLEAQSWREGLGQFARDSVESQADTRDLATPAAGQQHRALKNGMAWLAIAASLFVAFTLGVMHRENGLPIAAVEPNPNDQLAITAPSPSPATPETTKDDDALTLWVRDDAGQTRPLRVPLVDAGTLDRQYGMEFQPALPATMRERLQQRGFDVQSKRRYAPLWLENGRPMIVPVEDTKIVPVGQKVY